MQGINSQWHCLPCQHLHGKLMSHEIIHTFFLTHKTNSILTLWPIKRFSWLHHWTFLVCFHNVVFYWKFMTHESSSIEIMGHETPLAFFQPKFNGYSWGHEKLFYKMHWPWNDVHGILKWFSWDFHKSQFHSVLNVLIKHMVMASSRIAELWMHSGDSGLLSSKQLEELWIVYWRHQRAQ